ncbi:MAG: biopolymer transporter ExbD [Endomicrobiales bacterium]|nr:biopolymer transporter ExbD [Endomicrobiales bacterium]
MNFRKRFFHNEPQLDVAPLADIVFLLLIFFMLSSTLVMEPGIKLKLPKAKTSEIQSEDKLMISITKDKDIFVDDKKVMIDNLESEVRALLNIRREKYVVIRADKSVDHGLVVEVLDKSKLAGAKNLALAAEKK